MCVYTLETSSKEIQNTGIVRSLKLKIVYGKLRCIVYSYSKGFAHPLTPN